MDTRTGARLDVGLHNLEPKGSAKKNEGFFEKGLLKAMESDHLAGGNAREVKVIGNGHCHSACSSLSLEQRLTRSICSYGELSTRQRCLVVLRWWRVSPYFYHSY